MKNIFSAILPFGAGILLAASLFGAYYFEYILPKFNTTQAIDRLQTKVAPASSTSSISVTEKTSSTAINIQTNSAPCEEIATEAAQSEQAKSDSRGSSNTTRVTDAYFGESYTGEASDCFYELVTDYNNGTIVTAIHAAPNDEELGSCTEPYGQSSEQTCIQDGFGSMSPATFQLMEAKLFTN